MKPVTVKYQVRDVEEVDEMMIQIRYENRKEPERNSSETVTQQGACVDYPDLASIIGQPDFAYLSYSYGPFFVRIKNVSDCKGVRE